MNCEKCDKAMIQLYDVVERETRFVRWECNECSYELLERQPIDTPVVASA
ncbi:MAG: hypothetical protein R3F62_11145 [Planctomycetota bacterium]